MSSPGHPPASSIATATDVAPWRYGVERHIRRFARGHADAGRGRVAAVDSETRPDIAIAWPAFWTTASTPAPLTLQADQRKVLRRAGADVGDADFDVRREHDPRGFVPAAALKIRDDDDPARSRNRILRARKRGAVAAWRRIRDAARRWPSGPTRGRRAARRQAWGDRRTSTRPTGEPAGACSTADLARSPGAFEASGRTHAQ